MSAAAELELLPFTVQWETKPSDLQRSRYWSGARRVYAVDAPDAIRRGRRFIARDLVLAESSIRILCVERQVLAAP